MNKRSAYAGLLRANSIILTICLSIELIALLSGIVFNFIYPESRNVSGKNLFQLVLFTMFTFVLLYLNHLIKNRIGKSK